MASIHNFGAFGYQSIWSMWWFTADTECLVKQWQAKARSEI